MKFIAKLFYIGQIVGAVFFLVFALSQTVRSIVTHAHCFIVICFVALTLVSYYLMYVPSVKEYKEYKSKYNK